MTPIDGAANISGFKELAKISRLNLICSYKMLAKPVSQPYLNILRSREKKYEGRLASKIDEWNLEVGQLIKFYDPADPEIYTIALLKFPDFGAAYDQLGQRLLPGKTRAAVIELYNNIYHYPDEIVNSENSSKLIQDVGVVAIGFNQLAVPED